MAGRDVLDGVDDVPWGDLRHAYGGAGDVPALLRALGSGRGEAEEAVQGLFGSLCHQGTVYSATPYAVPFLARIAAAGDHGSLVLELLGCIAASEDECGLTVPGSARAAVTGQIGVLAPLLSDPDDGVRAATVWALAQCRAPGLLVPLLRERWDAERQPAVRAAVLNGLSVLDPGVAAAAAAGVLARPGDAGLRLIAALACVAARVPWSGQLHEAATAWMAEGDVLPGFGGGAEPFSELAVMLAAQGHPAAALRLVGAGLTGPVAPGVRKTVVWCAGELAAAYRSPAPALAALLAAVAGDDDAGRSAISLLRRLGDASRPVANQIAVIADVRGPDRRADEALACLIDLGDPRAARLLGRDLPCRPIALHAAASPTGRALGSPFPFEPILLHAVRDRLPVAGLAGNELIYLLSLLRGWGRAASPAIPEVAGLLPAHALAAGIALAAIGGAIPAAEDALRLAAATGTTQQRIAAASALRSLTGAEGPLLTAIEHGLRQWRRELRAAAEAVRTLDETAACRLVAAVTTALHAAPANPPASVPDTEARTQLALTHWHLTGDAALAIPVLTEALRQSPQPGYRWMVTSAADAAAAMGPSAMPLIPAILPLLDQPAQCPAATQALRRIDPGSHGGVETAVLADRLIAAITDPDSAQERAVAALAEIGPAHLTAHARNKLRNLADQDQRLVRYGAFLNIIRNDENLRTAIRQILSETR